MQTNTDKQLERCFELLADREGGPLSVEEQAELDRLLALHPEVDAESMERAAAAAALAMATDEMTPLPAGLRDRLETAADHVAVGVTPGHDERMERHSITEWIARPTLVMRLGWYVAAACLAIAALAWSGVWGARETPSLPPLGELASLPRPEPVAPQSPMDFRLREDVMVIAWQAIQEPLAALGVTGEVVWSTAEQRGYGFFYGLPVNDPAADQYQLWIFDKARPAEFPVNGGVFDSTFDPESDVLIVTIDPELHVFDPVGFAVTRERPGGVVVSDREQLLLRAER